MNNMIFNVVIPARLASTRLPNKPLADLGGKPMVVRVAERALLSGAAEVIVATDDGSIIDACEKHGIRAMMTLATHPSGTDRIAEVAQSLQWDEDAVVVNVQGDEPLIEPELIAKTAARIGPHIPMATVAHLIHDMDDMFNPNIVKVILDRENRALYFSRAPIPWNRSTFSGPTKSLPEAYPALRHVGLYAFQNRFLQTYSSLSISPLEQFEALEQLRVLWHGYAISVYVTPSVPAAGIDTPEDLERVRAHFVST